MTPLVTFYTLAIILLATVATLSEETPPKDLGAHSGFYAADIIHTSEDYAGAWLIGMWMMSLSTIHAKIDQLVAPSSYFLCFSGDDETSHDKTGRDRLLQSNESVSKILNLEGATFHVTRLERCHSCKTFLTRDYFDFMVEHQSSTTNNAPGDVEITEILQQRMKRNVGTMQRKAVKKREHRGLCDGRLCDERSNKTIAIMVFSTNSASDNSRSDEMQRDIRRHFFLTTFWSIYMHFSNIVIYVGNLRDHSILREMNLPLYDSFDLTSKLAEHEKLKWNGEGVPPAPTKQHLPKYSLLHTIDQLAHNSSWGLFKYVYYTEGDLILHLRQKQHIFNMIDKSETYFLAVPHRMQTISLLQDFPSAVHHHWPKDSPQNIPDVHLITENSTQVMGSCCDNGRYQFGNCGGWWYNCKEFGLKNHKDWIRFGRHGLTMPLSTEHQATCRYSRARVVCPMPDKCKFRTPRWISKKEYAADVCEEMPIIRKIPDKQK